MLHVRESDMYGEQSDVDIMRLKQISKQKLGNKQVKSNQY